MGYGTIRISDEARGTLRELARAEGTSMLALLDEAVEALRRQRFLEQVNAAYAALRDDPRAWEGIQAERKRS
jgi:predicted transcriptional regulator